MKCHDTFHASLLEPYVENQIEGRIPPPEPPVMITDADGDNHDEFVVEEILDKRVKRNKVEYLIHWKGYGIQERSWEPKEHLGNAKEILDEFETNYKSRRPVRNRKSSRKR